MNNHKPPFHTPGITILFAALLIVCAIALLSYQNIRATEQANEQYKISQDLANQSMEILSTLKDAETGQRGFLLTGNDEYLESYHQALLDIPKLLEQFKAQATIYRQDQLERMRMLEPSILSKLAELRHTVELYQLNEVVEAQRIMESGLGLALMHEIREQCVLMAHVASLRSKGFAIVVEKSTSNLRLVSILGSSLLFVFLLVTARLVFRSMTLSAKLYKELDADQKLLATTLASIGDAVITTDVSGKVTFMNPVAETMTGWTSQEGYGLPLTEVFHIVNANTFELAPNPIEQVFEDGKPAGLALHTLLKHRNGTTSPIEDSVAPIRNQDGNTIGAVLVFHDVTHAQKMAAKITHQASHDELTGLINRREFERRLEHALQTGEQDRKEHTLLYLDLDQFKIVNDTCGHMAGDELLRQLTSILQAKLRRNDTLARLGGDEFGVLLESCPTEAALRVADLLRHTVHEFHFVWKEKVFQVGLSIGLVTFSDGNETLADILRMADAACYLAKDNGRNRVQVYTPDDKALVQRHGQMGWIVRIQKALTEDRFILYSQKILRLDGSDEGNHYEMLLRMRDEDGTLVPPMAFIPAAERYGLMPQLDRWVITTTFAQYGRRHPSHICTGTCAINLSAASICDETFYEFVVEQFDLYKVPPKGICFEITETSAIANLTQAAGLMGKLKGLGCRFSLDDFGSGMSSFTYLKHLPIDYLKIDGGFVKDIVDDPIDHAMVEAINHIGHVMHIETIAEFVENDAILETLRGIGVDYAQGYGIEKPRFSG